MYVCDFFYLQHLLSRKGRACCVEANVTLLKKKLYYSRVHGKIHLEAHFTNWVLWHFQNLPWKVGFW